MIKLCEACYGQIADGEPHAVLRALHKVTASGWPEWRKLYLHHFDPEGRSCVLLTNADAARRG